MRLSRTSPCRLEPNLNCDSRMEHKTLWVSAQGCVSALHCYAPFIFAPLSYPCPLQFLTSRCISSSYFRHFPVSLSLVLLSTSKNPTKYLQNSTGFALVLRIRIIICSWWLVSGVQSSMIEYYLASCVSAMILFRIASPIRCVNSFWIWLPR